MSILQNRWLRIISVSLCVYFFTTWYYGWQYLYRFLLAEGVYSWKCAECDESYPGWNPDLEVCVAPEGSENLYVCLEQEGAVQTIYTIMSSSEFCGGIVAGILYDLVGYKIMFLIGWALNLVGSLGLSFASKSVPIYYFAAVCAGFSVNIICFAGYYVKDYFPGRQSFALNLNFATQWAGSSVMMILWTMSNEGDKKLHQLFPYFSLIGIPFGILFFFTIPKNLAHHQVQLKAKDIPVIEQVRPGKMKDMLQIYKQWDIPLYAFGCYLPIVLANNAYMTCIGVLGGDEASEFLGQVQLFQPLIQIGFALFATVSKTSKIVFWIPFVICWTGATIGLLSLVIDAGNLAWTSAGVVCFVVANTYVYAAKYILCLPMIDPALYGMTTGTVATISGALQMTNIFWRDLAVQNGTAGLQGFIWGYVVLGCLMSGVFMTIIAIRFNKGKLDHLRYIVSKRPDDGVHHIEDGNPILGQNDIDYEYYYDYVEKAN